MGNSANHIGRKNYGHRNAKEEHMTSLSTIYIYIHANVKSVGYHVGNLTFSIINCSNIISLGYFPRMPYIYI